MGERRLGWAQGGFAAVSVAVGVVLFWIALHCDGSDWFISQTHADLMYTALRQFREFPYFSFAFNGGSYLLQDPQSNLFSPVVPLVLLTGPSVGLRVAEALWGVLGVYAFTSWMRRRVSTEAALIGAVASALSLGVLWKVAVGNDMFLWHLGLPLLLWTVERVIRERTEQSALWFALVLGLLLLGPTFHSFTYLFLPAVPLFVVIEVVLQRLNAKQLGRLAVLLAMACTLALLMVSPKLVCWAKFPMSRPVHDHGTISLVTGLQQMFDYTQTKWHKVATSDHSRYGGWGLEECAIALPPIASLLALVGVVAAVRTRAKRETGAFAAVLMTAGVVLACSAPTWAAFRALTGGNFRVAPRFLGMTAFGLAIFAALGADAVLSRLKRAVVPAALGAIAVMCLSAIWWTRSAGQFVNQAENDTVHPAAMNPIELYRGEHAAASAVTSYTGIRKYRGQRDILHGVGYTDGFLVVGNEYLPALWASRQSLPVVVAGIDQSQVTVENLRIKLRGVAPHQRVFLRARKPAFGLSVTTVPPGADVSVSLANDLLMLENHGSEPVERVVLRARLPISSGWFVTSLLALSATIGGLLWWDHFQRRELRARTRFAVDEART